MKKVTLSTLVLGLLLSTTYGFISQPKKPKKNPVAAANQEKKNDKKKELSPEEQQKAWMEYATPGEVHKMIAQSNGKWNATTTSWMAPETEPMVSEGSCDNEMIMDGRYQLSKYKGTMMGMPFEGMGILGYDNAKEEFTNTWIDNMGTGTMTMKGKWN